MHEPSTPSEHDERGERAELIEQLAARWATMTPPIRPSREDQARFARALDDAPLPRDARVLLLGSTPELRSMVLERGHRLTGCDIDDLFWHAMARLRTTDGPETFIHGNWLDLVEGHYDLVLGDCAFNMLGWDDMGRLVPKIAALLDRGGRAIFRIQARNPDHDLRTLEDAIADFPAERTGQAFLVAHHFLVESLRSTLHPEMTNRQFYEAVVSRFLSPEQLQRLLPLTRDKRNFYPEMSALQALLRRDFEIAHQQPCPSPGAWDTAHLFVLVPRADKTEG
ncbi:MAG: class I SAM-dependent methyltransferase [Myxococcota bacterium]